MDRRRPAAVIGALCVSVAVVGGPVASAQPVDPAPRVVITDLPVLSELPPLPADGNSDPSGEGTQESEDSGLEMSGVQTVALVLAASVLVAGGLGLALVTRRGRGAEPDDHGGRPQPTAPT